MRRPRFAAAAALLLCATGCISPYVVPETLYRQVDQGVSFSQLRQDAGRYAGASVMLGGAVLSAKALPEGTEIEVLQLALDPSDRPTGAFEQSEGRFLLLDPGRRDPAVLRERLITVVGEVVGSKPGRIDETDYLYPYLSARFIHVWRGAADYPGGAAYPFAYPYYYPAYPAYSPYFYPYGPYYPYYYDPFLWSASFHYHDYHGPSGHARPERRFEPPGGGSGLHWQSPAPAPPGGGGGGGRLFK